NRVPDIETAPAPRPVAHKINNVIALYRIIGYCRHGRRIPAMIDALWQLHRIRPGVSIPLRSINRTDHFAIQVPPAPRKINTTSVDTERHIPGIVFRVVDSLELAGKLILAVLPAGHVHFFLFYL